MILIVEGTEMKERREALRLTQAELAEKLGVKENSVWRWENDRQVISKSIELAFEMIEHLASENLKNQLLSPEIREKRSIAERKILSEE